MSDTFDHEAEAWDSLNCSREQSDYYFRRYATPKNAKPVSVHVEQIVTETKNARLIVYTQNRQTVHLVALLPVFPRTLLTAHPCGAMRHARPKCSLGVAGRQPPFDPDLLHLRMEGRLDSGRARKLPHEFDKSLLVVHDHLVAYLSSYVLPHQLLESVLHFASYCVWIGIGAHFLLHA